MAWSTREVAEFAGTTVKTVRHYHKIGLLEEPERSANGYKQYQTKHLLRILQIKRLSELGVPLAQVSAMDASAEDPDVAIKVLDGELASTIERLERIRAELALLLQHRAPIDVPAQFAAMIHDLSEADRALLTVFSRVFNGEVMDAVNESFLPRTEADAEFEALDENASEDRINDLARRLAPGARALRGQEWTTDLEKYATYPGGKSMQAIGQALQDLYNIAQLKVMIEVHRIVSSDG
ncbi:MerR family DNA-binding transcriptional regulator [Cumulibacter soli]|uniref:helix-turn-helix domain-containing protein n=1 Tax=Cumulibacter soli TaxID=2546344 RepID=UPI0010683F20|nr:MerR family transcriptional regulator [Cumulibacter soli]